MELKILYEDGSVLAIDKPAGIVVFPEGAAKEKTLIDHLLERYPELKNAGGGPRYGIVHRLDKDTSGVLLIAKSAEALIFLQKQFKNSRVEKRYKALAVGVVRDDKGVIDTLIGRSKGDKRKQKVYSALEPGAEGKRRAITEYKVIARFENYTLLELSPKTGRKHQIRCHLAYIGHPIAGDKVYGFKNQPAPEGLSRQFLHAEYLKIILPDGKEKEFTAELPEDLKTVLNKLK